jgi:single-strand DNA-binding protein
MGSTARPGIQEAAAWPRRASSSPATSPTTPDLRHITSGAARVSFRVAVSSRVRDGDGWRDGEPAFHPVVAWRDQAIHAGQTLCKGSRAVVVGRLARWSWQVDESAARSVVEVVADELGPSVSWATAATTRATRTPSR